MDSTPWRSQLLITSLSIFKRYFHVHSHWREFQLVISVHSYLPRCGWWWLLQKQLMQKASSKCYSRFEQYSVASGTGLQKALHISMVSIKETFSSIFHLSCMSSRENTLCWLFPPQELHGSWLHSLGQAAQWQNCFFSLSYQSW